MSRRTERAILGWLAFAGAVLGLVVGVRLLTDGDASDVAAGSVDGIEVTVLAAPSEGSDSGVGATPDSMVASTTAGSAVTTSSSTTVAAPAETISSTADGVDSSTTTSTSSSSTAGDGSTSSSADTDASGGEDPSTTATSPSSSSSSSSSEAEAGSSNTAVRVGLSDVESEIIRLTNELRSNPAGPQRRVGAMPDCVNDDDTIEIDPETGHPRAVRRLTSSQPVSIRMSRDWSQRMADADAMSHRTGESQDVIYGELGIDWAARGENVAWAVGYEPSEVAQLFFRGWRESDGHYCNMMSGAFTQIGVGHVRTDGGKDFATQNFYRAR